MVGERGRSGTVVMARFAEPKSAEQVRLAVVADPHLSVERTGGTRQYHRTGEFLAAAIDDVNRRNVDLAVSVGDLTMEAERTGFDRVDELLADLDAPFLAVPGNHDVPKPGYDHEVLPFAEYVERYTPGNADYDVSGEHTDHTPSGEHPNQDPHEAFPYVRSVGDVSLVGLNTASAPDGRLGGSSEGFVSPAQLERLERILSEATHPIALLHHTLPDYAGTFTQYQDAVGMTRTPPPGLRNAEDLRRVLEAGGARLAVTGHVHVPGLGREGRVTELSVPSTCLFPQAYLLLDVDARGTTVRYAPIGSLADSRTAYIERAVRSDAAERIAVAASNLAQFPLREEWHPETAATDQR